MKKILFITNNWLYDYGGRRIASTKIINFLSSRGFDITVVDFEVKVNPIKIKNNMNFHKKVHVLTYFIESNSGLISYLIDISKSFQFNIVICSSAPYFDIITILSIKIARLFKKAKIILYAHTHPLKSIKIFSFSIQYVTYHMGYYFLSYFVYHFFDKIVTPCFTFKEFFVYNLLIKQEKILFINYPIFNGHNNKDTYINHIHPQKIIMTAVRLELFQKDFPTLFNALKEVNKKINCQLVILGEGGEKQKIIKLAKEIGIFKQVRLLGFKKNPIKYMRQADVFVLSTLFEGFGIVLVEAMIGKTPVISSDCDFGPREILENGKNGILVPVGDHISMSEAILKLLKNNKLREKFVRNGLERAKFYSEERSFRLWNKLLSSS